MWTRFFDRKIVERPLVIVIKTYLNETNNIISFSLHFVSLPYIHTTECEVVVYIITFQHNRCPLRNVCSCKKHAIFEMIWCWNNIYQFFTLLNMFLCTKLKYWLCVYLFDLLSHHPGYRWTYFILWDTKAWFSTCYMSLVRCGSNFKSVIFKLITQNSNMGTHIIQEMAWCRQVISHYLNQSWPRSMSPYGVTRPKWLT